MAYAPRHQKQLDGSPTSGEDCGVRSTSMAIDFATRGSQVPKVKDLRSRMGVTSGPTNTADQKKGAESYDKPNETGNRQPVVYQRKVAAPWDDFTGPLQNAEKAVVLSLSYKVVNEKKPGLSGDPNFNGNHSVMFLGSRVKSDGGIEVKSYDSLYDGRRSGIPNGPQWWPLWLVRDACAAFAGNGKATGGIVPTAYLLESSSPPPTTPPTTPPVEPEETQEERAQQALMEERQWLVESRVAAQDRIALIDTIYPPNNQRATDFVGDGAAPETEEEE